VPIIQYVLLFSVQEAFLPFYFAMLMFFLLSFSFYLEELILPGVVTGALMG
jgi:hypothetical protein